MCGIINDALFKYKNLISEVISVHLLTNVKRSYLLMIFKYMITINKDIIKASKHLNKCVWNAILIKINCKFLTH